MKVCVRLLKHQDAALRKRAGVLLATAVPADRKQVLADYQVVLKMKSDPTRGRAVFQKNCVTCHRADSDDVAAATFDLTPKESYDSLLDYADGDLRKLAFEKDVSLVGDCPSRKSKLLELLTHGDGHQGVQLTEDDLDRLITWVDTYAHRVGSFSEEQEEQLRQFRRSLASLLDE